VTAAIVLFPAIAGVNDYVRRRAEQLAAEGYAVQTVDYFSGKAPDVSTPQKIGAALAALSDTQVLERAREAVAALHALPGVEPSRIGAMGYCVGGMYAMLAAADGSGIAAVANYYGTVRYAALSANKPVSPLERVGELRAPMIAHYGTADRFVPQADVAALENALDAAGKPYELFRYGGAPHAFDEDFRPAYRPVAAAEAWTRTLGFFNWYLRNRK
jgi:dienelactone hydrolase